MNALSPMDIPAYVRRYGRELNHRMIELLRRLTLARLLEGKNPYLWSVQELEVVG